MINLTEAARAWAKTIAYINCGKPELAREWWRTLSTIIEAHLFPEGK